MSPGRLLGRNLSPADRRLALRIALVFAIPVTLIMMVPVVVGGVLYNEYNESRIGDNRESIRRVERERIERTRAINEFLFSQCINSEVRDAVTVDQYRSDIKLAKANFPPSRLLDDWIQVRLDGIVALEPPGEQDCTPPPATSP